MKRNNFLLLFVMFLSVRGQALTAIVAGPSFGPNIDF
jgi:hypothetical protein